MRPSAIWSSVAIALAITAGCRYPTEYTRLPQRTRSVVAASAAWLATASRQCGLPVLSAE